LPPATVRELLDAGMHYGHHASRWNPKMQPYIFGRRNQIHIINLRETMRGLLTAVRFVIHVVASGKSVVFVGTKRQARVVVKAEAVRCGMPFVIERWLGGTLTNFRSIRSRLARLEELEQMEVTGSIQRYSKKIIAALQREYRKVKRNLEGIRMMERLPGALIVVDPTREKNAVREAAKLEVPVVALADTEADPDALAVVIPGNDDAMRAIEIVLAHLADAVVEGKANRAARAVKEGEGQVLDRGPSRPRTRGGRRPAARTDQPVLEMPLPKPHPASRDAATADAETPPEPAPEKESAAESPGASF